MCCNFIIFSSQIRENTYKMMLLEEKEEEELEEIIQ
jgi:hypothetical protein